MSKFFLIPMVLFAMGNSPWDPRATKEKEGGEIEGQGKEEYDDIWCLLDGRC